MLIYAICIFRFFIKKRQNQTNEPLDMVRSIKYLANFKNEISFFKDTFKIVFKKRENNARFLLLLLLFIYFIGASVSMGLGSIQYLYLIKSPIYFTQIEYGLFKAMNILTRTLALLVILPILKYFKVPDHYLFLFGLVSEFFNVVVYAIASKWSFIIWFGKYFIFCSFFISKLICLMLKYSSNLLYVLKLFCCVFEIICKVLLNIFIDLK